MSADDIKSNLVMATILMAGMTGVGSLGISAQNQHREQVFEVACEGMEHLKKYDFTDKNLDIENVIAELREDHPDGNYGKVTLESMAGKDYQIYIGDKEIEMCFEEGHKINQTSDSQNNTSFTTENGDVINISNTNQNAISPDKFKTGRINNTNSGIEIS